MPFSFPKIYPILDASIIPADERGEFLRKLGGSLADAGVLLLEYRNKAGSEAELLADAEVLRGAMPAGRVKLILDDRADLVDKGRFVGLLVDGGDVCPAEARLMMGPDRIVGTFGGSDSLLEGILNAPVDYLAIGPVFPTRTKQTAKLPIGLEGVRRLRAEAGPGAVLVAAAGITLPTAAAVLEAGAHVVAVAEALFRSADPAAEYRRWAAELG